MKEDEFRKNVYNVLKAVEARTISISVAQRRIMRLARRTFVHQCVQRTELCSGVGHSVYESVINPGHCHVCGKPLSVVQQVPDPITHAWSGEEEDKAWESLQK